MIDWIKNLLNEKAQREIIKWEADDSIFDYLKINISENGSLKETAATLPDEKEANNEIKFAAGLMDSMFGAEESEDSKIRIKTLITLIRKIAENGEEQNKSDFYREVTENDSVIGIIDEFLQQLVKTSVPTEPHLFDYATQLATKTNNRNAVKFGIAILGLCQSKKPIEDLKILGLHDEFTVFSTVALSNLSDNLASDLWHLGKHVDGWGKIQLVDRFAELALTEDMRDWLVLEGYKNNIMYEYLALTCARNGKLNDKLKENSIDRKLFVSAGEIIVALMDENAAEGMSVFDEAAETVENYIKHSKNQNLQIGEFITLHKIKEYLEESPEENVTIKKWNQNNLSNCLIDIDQILKSKDWTIEVRDALKSSNDLEYWNAKHAAEKLGMELWDIVWTRLKQNPLDYSSWYDVTTYDNGQNVDEIIEFAKNNLPLDELGSGPKDSMGFGVDYHKHACLESVLTFLENCPNKGEELILVGLDSPVTRNRNTSIRVLDKWKIENWSSTITAKVKWLKEIEPDADSKKVIERLLKGQELE